MSDENEQRVLGFDASTDENGEAGLWSIACAVQRHSGCGVRLERGDLVVVCPCPCHATVVDAGPLDVRGGCLRWVEVVASGSGQSSRHSCECDGVGCPLDPRTVPGSVEAVRGG